jgi:DedD protein
MATTSSPDLEDNVLKRRARRRLIGSIALVLVAVIALPMVFDEEKKPLDQDVSVQIPNQDVVTVRTPSGSAAPKVVEPREPKSEAGQSPASAKPGEAPAAPKAEDKSSEPAKTEAKPPAAAEPPRASEAKPAKADAKVEPRADKPAVKSEARVEAKKPAEEARVKAILDDQPPAKAGQFAVQVGAFAADDKIREAREKLGSAGFRSYTEKLDTKDGERTRVRAGPFAGREAAEAARDKIRALGYANAAVVAQ